jgi:hypothetical protein
MGIGDKSTDNEKSEPVIPLLDGVFLSQNWDLRSALTHGAANGTIILLQWESEVSPRGTRAITKSVLKQGLEWELANLAAQG